MNYKQICPTYPPKNNLCHLLSYIVFHVCLFSFTFFLSDPCNPNPCVFGGLCTVISNTVYNCTCINGRSGSNCQIPGSMFHFPLLILTIFLFKLYFFPLWCLPFCLFCLIFCHLFIFMLMYHLSSPLPPPPPFEFCPVCVLVFSQQNSKNIKIYFFHFWQ